MSKNVVYVVKVVDSATGKLVKIGTEFDKVDKKAGKATGGVKNWDKSLQKVLKGGFVAGSIMMIGNAFASQAKQVIAAAGQIERYNATLETMLGSRSAARDRMEEYMRIAKTTPFEMTEVVEAGNKLQALGRYSEDTLVMLGDLAAASGKPLEQAMNAYSKMASGQKGIAVDMFRDLLITTDDWAKATGKGVKASGEMVASADEMLKVLPEILKSKGFFGLMAKQSETTEGKIANFEDAVFSLRASIGERLAPTTKSIVGVMSKWVSSMDEAVKIPVEQKIAREKAELNYLVENLIKANDNEEERVKWIAELQSKYPEFLKNVNLEKDGAKGLREELEKVNAEYDKKIRLAINERKRERVEEKFQDVIQDKADKAFSDDAAKRINELEKIAYSKSPALKDLARQGKVTGREIKQYLSEVQKAEYDAAVSQYSIFASAKKNKDLDAKIATYEKILQDLDAERNAIMQEGSIAGPVIPDISNSINNTNSNNSTVVATGGGGKSTGTTLGSGGGSGRGGGAVVNIGNLVGKIELHTVNMKEGVAEIKKIVTQALVEATGEIA
jgi:CBS domain-containing protein